jgi:hypothetical protein
MSLRNFLKKFGGHKGKATHAGTPGSHVNKAKNKRIANKATRHTHMLETAFCEEDELFFDLLNDEEPH